MSCIDCSPFSRKSGRMLIAAGPILLIGYTALLPLLAGKLTPLAASIWTSNTPQRTELTTAPPLAPSSHGPAILGPATRASEGLAVRLCIGMAGVSTQPSATVRAPSRPPRWGSPSRSWYTMDCVADHGSLHFVFSSFFQLHLLLFADRGVQVSILFLCSVPIRSSSRVGLHLPPFALSTRFPFHVLALAHPPPSMARAIGSSTPSGSCADNRHWLLTGP